MAKIQPVHWQRVGPELLPMRDHVAQIRELLRLKNLTHATPKRGKTATT